MEKRDKNLIKNTSILFIGNICTKGIMFIMSPLFARWVSKPEYGDFELLMTYISLLVPLVTLETGEAVFRFLVGDDVEHDKSSVMTNAMVSNLVSMVITFVGLMIFLFFVPQYRDLLLPYFVMVTSEVLYNFGTKVARGFKKMHIYAIANILYVFSMAITSVVLVKIMEGGLKGLIFSYSIGYLISAGFLMAACKIYKYLRFAKIDWKVYVEMCKYSLPLLPNAISWWIVNVSDRTIVKFFLGASANATLAIANKLPNLCMQFFKQFSFSWQESVVENMNQEDRDQFFSKVINKAFCLVGSMVVGLLGVNYFFFLIYPKSYMEAAKYSPIVLIAMPIYVVAQSLGVIYIGQMKTGKNGTTTTISAVTNVVINLALVHFIGLWAAVISTLVSYVVLMLIRLRDLKKTVKLSIYPQSYRILIEMIVFAAANYLLNNLIGHFICLLCAVIVFIFENYEYIPAVLKKVKSKLGIK